MFCKKCGKKVSEGEKYCSSCGTAVSDSNQDEHNHKNSHGCCTTIITILLAISLAAGFYWRGTNRVCKKTCHDDYGCLNKCQKETLKNHLNSIKNMFSSSNTSEELSPSARDVMDTTLNRSRATEDISACNSQLVADTLAEIVSGVEELPDVKASTNMTVQQKSNGSLKECETTLLISYPKSHYYFFDEKCLEGVTDHYLKKDKDYFMYMLEKELSKLFVDTGISYQFKIQKLKYTTESIIDNGGDDSVHVSVLDTDEQNNTIRNLQGVLVFILNTKECHGDF